VCFPSVFHPGDPDKPVKRYLGTTASEIGSDEIMAVKLYTQYVAAKDEWATTYSWFSSANSVVCTAATMSPACPAGTYQVEDVVWACGANSNSVRLEMKGKDLGKFDTIPAGVTGLKLEVEATVDTDLFLYDIDDGKYVVHYLTGVVNNTSRHGTYKGASISFSGDDTKPPVYEKVNITGATGSSMQIQVHNYANDSAIGTLVYSYDGIASCDQSAPAGCEKYNEIDARMLVVLWSVWSPAICSQPIMP